MIDLTQEDLRRIRCGLLLYAKNVRAAARASRGLQDSSAREFEEEADDIEQRVLPMLAVEEMAEREDPKTPHLHLVED
jgi:hypothetical protein